MDKSQEADIVEAEFDILNEYWNVYKLLDRSKLRARILLTQVFSNKKIPNEFLFEFSTPIFSVSAPTELLGELNNEPKPSEWDSLPSEDIEIEGTPEEKWNEYKIRDLNKIIRIKYTVSKIRRITKRYTQSGRPFYVINGGPAITII